MIIVNTQGRFGNQLFQYASGYYSSKKQSTFFFVDIYHSDHFKLHHYFKLRLFELYINKWLSFIFIKILKFQNRINKLYQIGHEPIEEVLKKNSKNCYQKGFFQSELYFKCAKSEIISLFQVKPSLQKQFYDKYFDLISIKPTLVVHVRGGDYFDFKPNGYSIMLPFSYFEFCFNKIEDIEKYQIIWVSDSIEYIKAHFGNKDNYFYSNENDIFDFQFLINADKLIISNSSFAWWGAYLNKKNAEVFAPKNWFNFRDEQENPVGISSLSWNWIDVN